MADQTNYYYDCDGEHNCPCHNCRKKLENTADNTASAESSQTSKDKKVNDEQN